jgi:iron complex outermembrane recepter protein
MAAHDGVGVLFWLARTGRLAVIIASVSVSVAAAEKPPDTASGDDVRLAQAGPPLSADRTAAPSTSTDLAEVVVTGSHIATSTFTTPTPVTVIDANTIQSLGLVSVADVIDQIPQNSNFTSAANVGLGNFNIGAQFANLRGLDPFFGTRTLTLVDSQRVVPTSAGGAVDLNIVPSIMIDRVDVVTGGASAAYGSDAVAGVVNILLDKKFEGFKLQLDGGETTYSDGGDRHAALEWGKSLFDGRVHELVGAEYEDAQGIGACGSVRPWCAQGQAEYTNSGYVAGPNGVPPSNGLPHYIVGPGATYFQPATGMLDSLTPAGYLGQFNTAGTALVPFNPGLYGTGLPFTATQNGSGPNYYDGVSIRPPVIHWSLYSHTAADLTDKVQASLDVSVAQRRAVNVQESSTLGAPANLIFPNNAYLTPGVAAAMGGVPAFLDDYVGVQAPLINSTSNYTGRIVLGLKGEIVGSWTWDGYYQWGETGTRQRLANDEVEYLGIPTAIGGAPPPAGTYDNINWALNAVTNPAGQIVCAATIPGNPAYNPLAAGCKPLNLFGAANASPAALAYAFPTLHEDDAFTEHVVSANAQGTLFDGIGAGPIKAAVGGEFRHSMADVTHDMAQQPWYNQYVLSYGEDYRGTIDVGEVFGETNVPLLKNQPFAKNLDLDFAVRETVNRNSNSLTGNSNTYNFPTWKFTVNFSPTDWVGLRATRSRDTRAPSFYELFSQTIDTGGLFGSVANPWKNPPGSPLYGVATDAARVVTGSYVSSLGLRPESADTTTAGIVLTPADALEGLRFSADWYQIIIHDAIAEVGSTIGGGGTIVNACYNGASFFCQFVQGTPNGTGGFSQITGVENPNLNLGSYTTRGVDFEFDYHLPFSRFGDHRRDSLGLRVLATYQYDQIISPGAGIPAYNYAGQTGPTGAFGDFNTSPKWQGNAFLTYNNGPITAVVQARVIGSGVFAVVDSNTSLPLVAPGQPGYATTRPTSINDNSVASATYFNFTLNYTLPFFNEGDRSLQLFGSVVNIFNRDPPVAPGGNGYPTNPVYFDTYGRTWRAGVRLRL